MHSGVMIATFDKCQRSPFPDLKLLDGVDYNTLSVRWLDDSLGTNGAPCSTRLSRRV